MVEDGYFRIRVRQSGREFGFSPAFIRTARLGTPKEILDIWAGLHVGTPETQIPFADEVLSAYCDEPEEVFEILGGYTAEGTYIAGAMPTYSRILLARRLMEHGIVGTLKLETGGKPCKAAEGFFVAEFIAQAVVHLGMSKSDAQNLTMTEFQRCLRAKYPKLDTSAESEDMLGELKKWREDRNA